MKLPYDSKKILENINIVLAYPQVAENIGLVARVLKNTGITNLSIVTETAVPVKSLEVAKRSRDTLEKAKIFKTLPQAISQSAFVFGTSRRLREYKFIYDFNDIKQFIISQAINQKISIVFGQEDFGLSKDSVELCDSVFYIPANPEFSSYNLAFSVGIVAWELFNLSNKLYSTGALKLAKKQDIETLFLYIEQALAKQVDKRKLNPILLSLKRILSRTQLTVSEVSLLKGLILKKLNK